MNVVILGCGRMGASTAVLMSRNGHNVTVIDKDAASARRLGNVELGDNFIVGNGLEIETLERAGLDKADAFVATTNYDNRNIMSSMLAKEHFSVPMVIARFYDSERAEIFSKLGIKSICVTSLGSGIVQDLILGKHLRSIDEYTAGEQK
ncbi:MAG: TrkA family potassium uptake protein [Abditibacteriota bacterium]|nr:TrkA family potassium uptake protein [Abditibacteriota bacterium]